MNALWPNRSNRDPTTGRILDLVVHFRHIYEFWYYRGRWNAVIARVIDLANALILWIMVFVFGLMFDWHTALNCEGTVCANAQLMHHPKLTVSSHPMIA